MSVLGEIGARLKTDIGEVVRASRDPVFARQLTERNFKREEREQIREADAREIVRQEQAEAEARRMKLKSTIQTKLVFDALEQGKTTGNFQTLFNLSNSPGLIPEIKEFAQSAYESDFSESFETGFKKQQLRNQTDQLNNNQKNTLLREKQINNQEVQFQQDYAFKQAKLQYEKGMEVARKNQDITDTQALVNSIRKSGGAFKDDEIRRIELAMTNVSPKQALTVYSNAWKRYSDKLIAFERAKQKARDRLNIPVTISSADVALAADQLKKSVPEFDDMDSDADRDTMARFVASRARHLARERTVDVTETILEAIDIAKTGLREDDDFFEFMRENTFSIEDIDPRANLKEGDVWISGGRRYRFHGGDWRDQNNWSEL